MEDPQFFMELCAHFICCVPISTFYETQEQEATTIFTPSYLLMIRVEHAEAQAALLQVITRRADASLFEQGVLDEIVRMSGGSPRQLLQIANQCLVNADTEHVSMSTLEYTLNQMTVDRERRLNPLLEPLFAPK